MTISLVIWVITTLDQPIQLTRTISLLELVYTTIAVVGILTMVYTAIDNRIGLTAAKEIGVNGPVEDIASIGFWDGIAGVIFHSTFGGIGLIAMTLPPAPGDRTFQTQLIAWAFVAAQGSILGIQIRNQVKRVLMRRIILVEKLKENLDAELHTN